MEGGETAGMYCMYEKRINKKEKKKHGKMYISMWSKTTVEMLNSYNRLPWRAE